MYANRVGQLVTITLAMVFVANSFGEEIVLGPASRPHGSNTQPVQVPLETIQRTFNQSVDQAQKAEAIGTESNLQRAMALYRKAQVLGSVP